MTPEQEIEHLRTANMALQRRLERARRDALLYAASLCEDYASIPRDEGYVLFRCQDEYKSRHAGAPYAAKLREIAK